MRLRRRGARRIEGRPVRRTWRRALAALVVAGVALLALGFERGAIRLPEPSFAIRTVKVESTFERVSRDEVAAVVAPYARSGFFEVDLKAVREALVALPWVRTATVRRVWPDTLHVVLAEERPVARWRDSGLVNDQGEVFYPDDARAAGAELPLLEGPERTSAAVLGYFREVSDQLAPLGLQVVHLSMDARRAWEITLGNGMHLTLGRRAADQQLRRFVHFYPGMMAARAADIVEVDLRYSNGFAVRWRGGPAAAQAQAAKKTGDAA
jgi:cell division protein FtsQ